MNQAKPVRVNVFWGKAQGYSRIILTFSYHHHTITRIYTPGGKLLHIPKPHTLYVAVFSLQCALEFPYIQLHKLLMLYYIQKHTHTYIRSGKVGDWRILTNHKIIYIDTYTRTHTSTRTLVVISVGQI